MKVVELGGGANPLWSGGQQPNGDYYVNLDVRKVDGVDIVGNLEEKLPLNSDDFDLLWCKYSAEHVSWRNVQGFFGECHRVLKQGGRAVFIVPNLRRQAEILASKREWTLETDICMVFGDLNYSDNSHKSSMDYTLMKQLLEKAGFRNVVGYEWPYWTGDMGVDAEK